MLGPKIAPSAYEGEELTLGICPEVGLKAARAKQDEARALLRDGKDPGAIRAADKARAKHDAAITKNRSNRAPPAPWGYPRGRRIL